MLFSKHLPQINFRDTNKWPRRTSATTGFGGYNEDDWKFYKRLRDSNPDSNPKRLTLYAGSVGQYWNQADGPAPGVDGLHILAPTTGLVAQVCNTDDYNVAPMSSCTIPMVTKYFLPATRTMKRREHILSTYESAVSGRCFTYLLRITGGFWTQPDFLDVVNPGLTLFGNADSEHLAYGAWYCRDLPFITNNQAGCVGRRCGVRSYECLRHLRSIFARASNPYTFHSDRFRAHYWGTITKKVALKALRAR